MVANANEFSKLGNYRELIIFPFSRRAFFFFLYNSQAVVFENIGQPKTMLDAISTLVEQKVICIKIVKFRRESGKLVYFFVGVKMGKL